MNLKDIIQRLASCMGLIRSADLIHMNYCRPFKTASGSTAEKDAVVLHFDDHSSWELTWSPSMGVKPLDLYESMRSGIADKQTEFFIKSHLHWRQFLEEHSKDKVDLTPWIKAEEVSVGYTGFRHQDGIDLLRVKCRTTIPEWLYGRKLPQILVLDFNGSANLMKLNYGLQKLAASNANIHVYLEEPGFIYLPHSCKQISEIIDRGAYTEQICETAFDSGTVATIKFGRNSVEEYRRLISAEARIAFGAVLCSKNAYEQVRRANEILGSFPVHVVRRDGLEINEATNPRVEIISSETNIADRWQALA